MGRDPLGVTLRISILSADSKGWEPPSPPRPPTPTPHPSPANPARPWATPLTLYTNVHTKSMKPTCSLGSSAALFRSIIGLWGSRDTVRHLVAGMPATSPSPQDSAPPQRNEIVHGDRSEQRPGDELASGGNARTPLPFPATAPPFWGAALGSAGLRPRQPGVERGAPSSSVPLELSMVLTRGLARDSQRGKPRMLLKELSLVSRLETPSRAPPQLPPGSLFLRAALCLGLGVLE